jgi:hypothetical protein
MKTQKEKNETIGREFHLDIENIETMNENE